MMSDSAQDSLRHLPAIDKLLNEPSLRSLQESVPRPFVVKAARSVLDSLREEIRTADIAAESNLSLERIARDVSSLALQLATPSLRRAVNATGIILHTGLGRAVLPDAARNAVAEVAAGHSTLEIDVESGARGYRSEHYRQILSELCGSESAFAVNNNAGAVLLALNTLAAGREVIVSRGQLVEIGGSFRMPDVMIQAGVRLIEVGTTNRTRISDFERAITDETALLLRVHPSNYRVVGFTEEASLADMVELGQRFGIPVVDDLGSGALIDLTQYGLRYEPLVQESVRAGVDIVTFSGDKLLGGPQAGLIVGKQPPVDAIARNPLARALRLDKLVLAGLEATLRLYLDPESAMQAIPTLRAITRPPADIEAAARELSGRIDAMKFEGVTAEVVDGASEVGGGSLPGEQLPSKLVAITSESLRPDEIARGFRRNCPPIFGRVGEDRFLLDMRTVGEGEIDVVASAAECFFRRQPSSQQSSSR